MASFRVQALVAASVALSTVSAQQTLYGQCGGREYQGSTACAPGSFCSTQNVWYAQCTPTSLLPSPTPAFVTVTVAAQTAPAITPAPVAAVQVNKAVSSTPKGQLQYAGLNIGGFDFGIYDSCGKMEGTAFPPLVSNGIVSSGGPDGPGQMNHFVRDDNLNAFRLPVTWQYLSNSNYASGISPQRLSLYSELVHSCLHSGAQLCIIDLHNYARWQGAIIGQDANAPSSAQFAGLWHELASEFKGMKRVAFALMNEPNDGCGNTIDPKTWAVTLQGAVHAIRDAGAESQYIFLPGKNYAQAMTYTWLNGASNGDMGSEILGIKDADGSTEKLVIDVHQYLDSHNGWSGKSQECTYDGVSGIALGALAKWLERNGRKAFLTETGGGNTESCVNYLKQELGFLSRHSDVFLGYTAWAAGSFDESYELSLTPTQNGDGWTDTMLVTEAVALCFTDPEAC